MGISNEKLCKVIRKYIETQKFEATLLVISESPQHSMGHESSFTNGKG